MNDSSSLKDDWDMLVETLGGSDLVERLARETGAFTRSRNVKDAESLLRLCLTYGPGDKSLRVGAAWAEATGVASLSDVALLKRLRKCPNWLEALIGTALQGLKAEDVPDRPVRVVDGSVVPKRGSEDGVWRIHSVYDLQEKRFSFFQLSDEKTGEQFDIAPVVPGEIRLGDRAYMQADRIEKNLDGGGDIIVRSPWSAGRWLDKNGEKLDLIKLLHSARKTGHKILDRPIMVGLKKGKSPLALRLVAIQKPPGAAKKARRKARKTAKRKGHQISKGTLEAAGWLILMTSLVGDDFSADKLSKLYRLRWQTELAFKRLKSLIGTRCPPAKNEDLAKVFILSHLLLAVIIEPSVAKLRDSFP